MDRVYFAFVVQPFDYLILLSLQTTTELEYLFLNLRPLLLLEASMQF